MTAKTVGITFDPKAIAAGIYERHVDRRVWAGSFEDFWAKCLNDFHEQSDGRKGATVGVMNEAEYALAIQASVLGLNAMAFMREAERARRHGDAAWEAGMCALEERLNVQGLAAWMNLATAEVIADTKDGAGVEEMGKNSVINGGERSDSVMKMLVERVMRTQREEEE